MKNYIVKFQLSNEEPEDGDFVIIGDYVTKSIGIIDGKYEIGEFPGTLPFNYKVEPFLYIFNGKHLQDELVAKIPKRLNWVTDGQQFREEDVEILNGRITRLRCTSCKQLH